MQRYLSSIGILKADSQPFHLSHILWTYWPEELGAHSLPRAAGPSYARLSPPCGGLASQLQKDLFVLSSLHMAMPVWCALSWGHWSQTTDFFSVWCPPGVMEQERGCCTALIMGLSPVIHRKEVIAGERVWMFSTINNPF